MSAKRGQAQSIPAPTQQALRTLEWVLAREPDRVWARRPLQDVPARAARRLVQPGIAGVLVRRHRVDDTVTKAITRILRSDLVMVMVDDIGLLAVGTDATVR